MLAEKPEAVEMAEATQNQDEEEKSKDLFFEKISLLGDEMIAKHGKEFTMGAFLLAARFIAEGRALNRNDANKSH